MLIGGAGNDRFIFSDNWDNDTITDFEDGGDLIDLRNITGVTSLADLMIANNANGDAVITVYGDLESNSITLKGVTSVIGADNFIFKV